MSVKPVKIKPRIFGSQAAMAAFIFPLINIISLLASLVVVAVSGITGAWVLLTISLIFLPFVLFAGAVLHREIHVDHTDLVVTHPYLKYFSWLKKDTTVRIPLQIIDKITVESDGEKEAVLLTPTYWRIHSKHGKNVRVPFAAREKHVARAIKLLSTRHIFIIRKN